MLKAMLTTVDNPHNPFDDYDSWYAFDTRMGYNSAALLARVAMVSDELTEVTYVETVNDAIEEIINENVSGMHTKVEREFVNVFEKAQAESN